MDETTPDTPERACPTCGAGMAGDQDWCLTCGSAAPGRLGTRPGWRAAVTVAGLTLTLVTGAVAASYAALSDDANRSAGAPAPPSATPVPGQQAQVPPSAAPAPEVPTPEVPTSSTPASSTPTVPDLPSTGAPAAAPSASAPKPQTSAPSSQDRDRDRDRERERERDRAADDDASERKERAELRPIALGADAAALYDPYGRAVEQGDPADVQDDRDDTSWFVTTPEDGNKMQVGLVIDLEANKHVRAVDVTTSTPGFRLELFGADTSVLPPDVLDTRWANIGARSDVDARPERAGNEAGDGRERVVLPKDGDRYRYVLLWFTTPPDKGLTVKLGEVTLLG